MQPLRSLVFIFIFSIFALPATQAEEKAKPLDFMWVMRSWDVPEGKSVTALSITSDGGRIALAGRNYIALQERETGKEIWRVGDTSNIINALHFSPDGNELYVTRGYVPEQKQQGGIAVIDTKTGKVLRKITGNADGNGKALLSPNGKLVLSNGGSDFASGRHADLWDAQTGEWLSRPAGKYLSTDDIAFMPDGKSYLCTEYASVKMHETLTGKLLWQINEADLSQDIAVSPKGEYAILSDGRKIDVLNIAEKKLRVLSNSQHTTGATFVSDEHFLTWGGELRMWNVRTGEEISWSGTYEQDVKIGAAGGNYFVGGTEGHLSVWGLSGIGAAPKGAAPLVGIAINEGNRPNPPLVLAAKRGDESRVLALLSRGADVHAMMGMADRSGTTALHVATTYTMCKALLDAGADVNAVSVDDWYRAPIHFIVELQCLKRHSEDLMTHVDLLKTIDLLLDKGADIEATFGYKVTPLQIAAKDGNKELCAHLIVRGAYYDIFSAAALGDIDRLTALLRDKPELAKERNPVTKENALYWASTKKVIKTLMIAGAETDIEDAWEKTPAQSLRGNRHEDLADEIDKFKPFVSSLREE